MLNGQEELQGQKVWREHASRRKEEGCQEEAEAEVDTVEAAEEECSDDEDPEDRELQADLAKEQAEEAEDGEGRGSLFLPWVVLEDWFTNAFGLDGWCSFVCSRKDTWRFNILARDGGIQGT